MNHPTSCLILECLSNIHVDEKPIYRDPSLGANSTFNINAESQKYFFFCILQIYPPGTQPLCFWRKIAFWFVCKFYQELFPILESHVVDDSAAYIIESPIHTPPLVCIWNHFNYADSMNIYFTLNAKFKISV